MADFSAWRKDWSLMGLFFTAEETSRLFSRLAGMTLEHLIFASFENRFAKSGGLAAVTVNTLPWLQQVNGFKTAALISPYYPRIMGKAPLEKTGKQVVVYFGPRMVEIEILAASVPYTTPASGSVTEYFLSAEGFFTAENALNDPYGYFLDQPAANDSAIRRNALLFCQAVPAALAALGIEQNTIIHAQEWQTALLALTVKEAMCEERLHSCAVVNTIHNPFDSYCDSGELAQIISAGRQQRVRESLPDGATAWQIGLRLADGPITTVSEHFAGEFTSDPIHTAYFAPHLQPIFQRSGVFGINNGPFLPFSADFPQREHHTIKEIATRKQKRRAELLQVLTNYQPAQRFGRLTWQGGEITTLPEEIPLFVMSGRLDPGQKGYDILLQAIERFGPDEIKVILTPLATNGRDLDYFYQAAGKCDGNLTVFPIRMQEGYQALQTGATFGLMPSIYEPFGAAIEYMVNGTVVIARAIGGLKDQITNHLNGLLYREESGDYSVEAIRDFAAAAGIVQWRKTIPWAAAMADALTATLKQAMALYREQPQAYYEMIRQGFIQAGQFSWEKNAREYGEVYSLVRK